MRVFANVVNLSAFVDDGRHLLSLSLPQNMFRGHMTGSVTMGTTPRVAKYLTANRPFTTCQRILVAAVRTAEIIP